MAAERHGVMARQGSLRNDLYLCKLPARLWPQPESTCARRRAFWNHPAPVMSPLQHTLRRMLRVGRPEAAPPPGVPLAQPIVDRQISTARAPHDDQRRAAPGAHRRRPLLRPARRPRRLRRVRRLARRLGAGDDPHAPGARRHRPRHPPLRHLRGDDRADRARRLAARPARARDLGAGAERGERAWSELFDAEALQRGRTSRERVLATGYPRSGPLRRGPGRGDAPRRTRPSGSRCCGSTPTGTSRPRPRSSTSTRGSPRAAC